MSPYKRYYSPLKAGLLFFCLTSPVISLSVPIVDFSTDHRPSSSAQTTSLTVQGLTVMQNRLDNYDQQRLPEKIELLTRQIASLRGQLEEQAHALAQLNRRLTVLATTPPASKQQQYQAAASSSAASASTNNDSQSYRAAFEMLQAKQYEKAISAFGQFKQHYPSSPYVANANYWLAQIYQLQGHLKKAESLYASIVKEHPNSPKVANALYKLALLARQQGQPSQAKHYLETLIAKFPNHAIASAAKAQLAALANTSEAVSLRT